MLGGSCQSIGGSYCQDFPIYHTTLINTAFLNHSLLSRPTSWLCWSLVYCRCRMMDSHSSRVGGRDSPTTTGCAPRIRGICRGDTPTPLSTSDWSVLRGEGGWSIAYCSPTLLTIEKQRWLPLLLLKHLLFNDPHKTSIFILL